VIRDTNGLATNSGIQIEATDYSVQKLAPPNNLQRFEGIAFSSLGNILGVATSDTNTVFLFRRKPNGLYEDTPYWTINGPKSGLNYPHDLSFSVSGDTELLAVAQRAGSISIYKKNKTNDNYSTEPVFEICGPAARLNYSDGVAFVPPNNDYLAACNLKDSRITFYRKSAGSSTGFKLEPIFELKHRSVFRPDGLAFSESGEWLAVANHGNHTVSIYQRRKLTFFGRELRYGPKAVTIIGDPTLRYPHSVAFTPKTNHLVVTNAGANYFNVYQPEEHCSETRWSQSPVVQKTLGPDVIFKEVNARNKMEGGPKGVAIHRNSLAICSPEYGVKIYCFHENLSNY
jgi:6-phosphogluconolactonase (cycloisomerase 2 family)